MRTSIFRECTHQNVVALCARLSVDAICFVLSCRKHRLASRSVFIKGAPVEFSAWDKQIHVEVVVGRHLVQRLLAFRCCSAGGRDLQRLIERKALIACCDMEFTQWPICAEFCNPCWSKKSKTTRSQRYMPHQWASCCDICCTQSASRAHFVNRAPSFPWVSSSASVRVCEKTVSATDELFFLSAAGQSGKGILGGGKNVIASTEY